jgi:hypothetical protein
MMRKKNKKMEYNEKEKKYMYENKRKEKII